MELLLLIHNNCGDVEKVLDRNGLRGSMKDSRLSIGLLNLIIIVPAPPWLRTYPYFFAFTPEDYDQIYP